MIDHILFPTDDSETSQKALLYLKELAIHLKASVTILHVYPPPSLAFIGMYDNVSALVNMEAIEEVMIADSTELVEDLKKELEAEGVQVKNALVVRGETGPSIVQIAEKDGSNLIVMGTRGLRAIKSFLLGSVSHYVIHHTKIPVFLVSNSL